jgi:hypothetical protein
VNSVEQAIRAALAKGDANDSEFRRRIFASASAALERSLAARAYSDAEIDVRRQGLSATIKHIESDFIMAAEPEPMSPQAAARDSDVMTSTTAKERPRLRKKQEAIAVLAADRLKYENVQRFNVNVPRKNRPWFKYAFNFAVLLALTLAAFWMYSEGKRIYENATMPSQNGQKPVLAETSGAVAAETVDWVQIFTARDTDLVSAASGAKAEISSRDNINYVVMSGNSTNEVSIKIGSGLVQTFAGKRVLFNIKARSADGANLDTGAHCDFGVETKCERKRFKIGPQSAEYMFAVSVSASATGDGALLIAPDLAGGGGSVEIESIRATIVQPDAG